MKTEQNAAEMASEPPPPAGNAEDVSQPEAREPALSWWQHLSFALVDWLLWGICRLLTLKGVYGFGCAFGSVEWLINYKRRRRFAVALERVLGRPPTPAERRREGRFFVQRTRCAKIFSLLVARLPRDQVVGLLTITNRELLEAALARRRGVYLALSHHGDHHAVGTLLVLAGYRIAVVRDRDEGGVRAYVEQQFRRLHPDIEVPPILAADVFPRRIYRCLHEGRILMSLMDVTNLRRANLRTHTVRVSGGERKFLVGPMQIALRCGAPILQGFLATEPGFRYRLEVVDTLLDPEQVTDAEADIRAAIERYAARVEGYGYQQPGLLSRI
ncbi:MAG TPA: hypothetical protein PKK06_00340 [Phycisphaerae bacterium]|nr:hypothetical protein [Phycisphaerae bacterium]HNU43942.1 hypothetical protein [Phycisphaerae bacterium]